MRNKFDTDELEAAKDAVVLAEKLFAEYSGLSDPNYSVQVFSDCLVVVDDGADRWLGDKESYQESLDNIVKLCMDNTYNKPDIDDGVCDVYADLCHDVQAIWSNIGTASFADPEKLRTHLKETYDDLDDDDIDEIFEALSIPLDEEESEDE